MRCSQCGMPLSPSRTSCPRCGAAVGNGGIRPAGKIRLTQDPSPPPSNPFPSSNINASNDAQSSWGAVAPAMPPLETQPNQGAFSPQAGQFPPATEPYAYPSHADAPLPMTAGAQNNMYIPSTPTPAQSTTPHAPRMAAPSLIQSPQPPRRQPKTRLGFTVAGMCLMAGALIMVFVFIMAQSLQLTPMAPDKAQLPTSQPVSTSTATQPVQPHITPTTLPATSTPPASVSQYVDNTSLTNGVDMRTGQPLQATQSFRLGQSVYVTMTIHQAAYNGAICLDWSVNNQTYPYANPAAPPGATYLEQTSAYFYYKPGAVGPGFVDISWASSTACTGKILIQHLPFIVTA